MNLIEVVEGTASTTQVIVAGTIALVGVSAASVGHSIVLEAEPRLKESFQTFHTERNREAAQAAGLPKPPPIQEL